MATTTKIQNIAAGVNPEKKEGKIARAIEEQTAKIPSDAFLWAAVGTMACSLTLKLMNNNSMALFVGQWPAPFLLLGIYNKLVKQEGHDKTDRGTYGTSGL